MSSTPPVVRAPAPYVSSHAVAFGSSNGPATLVDGINPLPVAATLPAAASVPVAGTLTDSGSAGPFAPLLGRAIWVTLSGSWTGSVQLLRSTDGGETRLPLTLGDGTVKAIWSGTVQASVTEETVAGASYYLQFTRSGGTLSYWVEQ